MTAAPIVSREELLHLIEDIAETHLHLQTQKRPTCAKSLQVEISGINTMAETIADHVQSLLDAADVRSGAGFTISQAADGAETGTLCVEWPADAKGFRRVAFALKGTPLHRAAEQVAGNTERSGAERPTGAPSSVAPNQERHDE